MAGWWGNENKTKCGLDDKMMKNIYKGKKKTD